MSIDPERDRAAGMQGQVENLSKDNSASFWTELSQQLPSGTSAEDKAKRKELFRAFDVNGNGFLSLAEVDKGIGGVIKSETLFSAKRPIMRAFQAAKGLTQSKAPLDDDTINRKEFQDLLGYLRQYFELYVMFAVVDKSDDNKISADEFKSSLPALRTWGVDVPLAEADAVFANIDSDKGGAIMFDEFADWAYQQKLDLEVDDDNEAPKYQAGNVARNNMDTKKGALSSHGGESTAAAATSSGGGGGGGEGAGGGGGGGFGDRDRSAGMAGQVEKFANKQMSKEEQVEFWAGLSASLPAGTDKSSETLRKKLFKQFDSQGNGYLSLAEIDKGIGEILRSDVLFSAKKAIMRAYQAAKNAAPSKTELGKDMVEINEFRLLLVYLRQYFELYVMFSVVDTTDDQRVSLEEFKSALPDLAAWGVKVDDPESSFKEIDQDGGGMVLFDEFADWALKKALDLEVDDDAATPAYVAGNLTSNNMNTKKGAALGGQTNRRAPRPASAAAAPSRKPSVPSAVPRRPASGRTTNQSAFSTEEDRTLLLMRNRGKTFYEIAKELGRGRTPADVKARWGSPQFAKKKDYDANQRKMKSAVAQGSTWGAASRASPSGTMPFMKVAVIPSSMKAMYDSNKVHNFNGRGAASFAALAGVAEAPPPPPPAPVRPQPAASVRSGYAASTHSHRSTLLSHHS